MDDSDNSNMFKVDHSEQFHQDSTDKRIGHLFDKDKKILNDGQKRMVVYGAMEKEPRTIYQIMQPYVMKAAALTGEAAIYAGKGIYTALANGATWVYDKFVNNVIPYTTQQLPKLFFVIKNNKKEQRVYSSDSFAVLEVEDGDYAQIKKKQNKLKNHKKRVIIPMGQNQDPEFIKFLEKQNYVPDNSFPIDADSDESETFMIPSANFRILHDEAIKKVLPEPGKNIGIAQYQTQQIAINPKEQHEPEQQKQQQKQQQNPNIRSYIDEMVSIKEVEDYKKVSKKVFKLKDCYIFQLQGKNSIEYELLDGIQKDQNTKCGFLVKSNHFNLEKQESGSDEQPSYSGEAPLLIEKTVDRDIKVRVQLPTKKEQESTTNKKKEEFILA